MSSHQNYERLLARARQLPPAATAVAHPWQNVVSTAADAVTSVVSQPIADTFFEADRKTRSARG